MAANLQPIAVIARLLDLTERRIQQLGREGIIPKPERGQYDLVGAVRGYVHYLREQAGRNAGGAADFGTERVRLIKAKADLAEMEAAQMRGDLVAAMEVEQAWTDILALLKARLLILPDRLAPLVHEEATVPAARNLIRKAIVETLTELAARPIIASEADGAGKIGKNSDQGSCDPDAAAGDDDQ
jgi:phage terminase Nu1 subunit (DNA packaging protein)